MAYKEIYQRYISKLIRCLPMDDGLFLVMLSEHELLPGDTEGKVKSLNTQAEKATYFISHVIKPSLEVDSRVYLDKLLLVMSESGYKHVEEISCKIKSEISNSGRRKTAFTGVATADDHDSYTERFKHESDAVGAFVYLFNKLAALFEKVEFEEFKRMCALRGAGCPPDFRKQTQAAETLDDILDILENPVYCNWLNIRLLRRIVKLTEISEAQSLLDAYEKCLYSKKVSEVRPYFKSIYFDPKHFSKVEAKINKHAEMLVVSDVVKFCQTLESDFKFPNGSVIATNCDSGCFILTCIIPVQCASHAYKMASENIFRFRKLHIQYLEIEPFEKLFARIYCMSKPSSELAVSSSTKDLSDIISDHYTYLEGHMDADSVSHMMQCEHLITDDDYEAITTAPNDAKMNCLLLHYVKLMDTKMLFQFCGILKSIETQQSIGEGLEVSLNKSSEKYLEHTDLFTVMNESSLKKNKWTSSLEPLHVHLQFFDLVDKIILLLSVTDKISFDIVTKCRSLMASDTHNIPLFAEPFLSKVVSCKSVFLFKILLLPFLSWFDHSILKELTSDDDSVADLLAQFDSLIDTDKSITAYPIPTLTEMMIPLDDRFTIVATKYSHNLEDSSLKEIIDIKAALIDQWEITEHAIQLIAVCIKLNYLYWIVPNCVVSVITNSSHSYEIQYELWERGITMTAILPDLFTNDHVTMQQLITRGPFSVLSSQEEMVSPLYYKLLSVDAREIMKQSVLVQEKFFVQYQKLKSEYKYVMAKLDDSDVSFKLKATLLENENKSLVKSFQKIKEKTSELEGSISLLQKEKEELLNKLQDQQVQSQNESEMHSTELKSSKLDIEVADSSAEISLSTGVNVLGDAAKGSIIERSIFHKDHGVDVHVLTTDELQSDESYLLGVNHHTDTNVQLELLCGLHGSILTKLDPDCHLVSPIVMIRGGDRPLKMKIVIPHALEAYKNQTSDKVKIFTVKTAGGIPEPLPSLQYKINSRSCIVTAVINKQQLFAVTVMGNLKDTRLLSNIFSVANPPAITCVYAVFCKRNYNPLCISVMVYCAIDLKITRKLLSNIRKEQPDALGTFALSHNHIDISYKCVRNSQGSKVLNSPHNVSALLILPSLQSEHFVYPLSWEFKVVPGYSVNLKHVACKMLITAGRIQLAQNTFYHALELERPRRLKSPNIRGS